MSSNLATLGYPQIDKICDAKFVKNATGFKVKKDLVSFVEHSEKTQVYFDIKEKEIKNNLAIHQQDLRDFFKTMETDMTAHKKKAKELEQNKEKMAYNELKKKIIAEWQQEEADKKKAAELEAKIQAKIAQKGGQNVSGGSILGCESTISGTKKNQFEEEFDD